MTASAPKTPTCFATGTDGTAQSVKPFLAGPHGVMFERLSYLLKSLELRSATVLLAFVRGIDWTIVPNQTRLIVLHEIDRAVTDLCTVMASPCSMMAFLASVTAPSVTIRQTSVSRASGAARGEARFDQQMKPDFMENER